MISSRPLLLAVGLMALAACRPGPPGAAGFVARRAADGSAAPAGPARGLFEQEILLTGELEAVRSISIKSPQTALFQMRIQHMAEEGDPVKAGETILTFDSSSLVAQVEDLKNRILDAETQLVAQQATLQSAVKDLEIELAERENAAAEARLEASVEKDVLPAKVWGERQLQKQKAERELVEAQERRGLTQARGLADIDVLTIQRDKLRQDLELAEQSLGLLSIEAPADGVVVYERRQENLQRFAVGDSCWPGQGLMQIPDLSEMRVVFSVPEVDAPLLAPGMGLAIGLDAFPGRALTGTIESIPSMAVRRGGETSRINVFRVRAALSETWVGEMKPGMSVRGRAVTERIENAPVIAREEVAHDGDAWWWPATVPRSEGVELRPKARNATHYLLTEDDFARLAGAKGASA